MCLSLDGERHCLLLAHDGPNAASIAKSFGVKKIRCAALLAFALTSEVAKCVVHGFKALGLIVNQALVHTLDET